VFEEMHVFLKTGKKTCFYCWRPWWNCSIYSSFNLVLCRRDNVSAVQCVCVCV